MVKPTKTSLKQYYIFWLGQQLSLFGSSLVSFAIIWWLSITTGSGLYLALASIATFLPMMAVQFFSGYLTDYSNRKWILSLTDLGQAIATTILLFVFYIGIHSVIWVLGILFIRGIFNGLHSPASRAILPTMVPEEHLQRVNSLSSLSRGIINLSSPVIGAFLVLLFAENFWVLLSIDAITFLLAVVPLLVISIPDVRKNHSTKEKFVDRFFGGYKFLKSSTGLLPLLFIYSMFNFFVTPASMLTPLILLSSKGFAVSEVSYGLIMIVSNVGFLLMSMFLSKIKLPFSASRGVILVFSVTVIGLATISFSLLTSNLIYFIVGKFIIGMSLPIVNVFSSMIWQKQVPANLQGRVVSVRMIITMFALPIVMQFIGVVEASFSFFQIFSVSAVGFSLLLTLIWVFSDFRHIDGDSRPVRTKEHSTKPSAVSS